MSWKWHALVNLSTLRELLHFHDADAEKIPPKNGNARFFLQTLLLVKTKHSIRSTLGCDGVCLNSKQLVWSLILVLRAIWANVAKMTCQHSFPFNFMMHAISRKLKFFAVGFPCQTLLCSDRWHTYFTQHTWWVFLSTLFKRKLP